MEILKRDQQIGPQDYKEISMIVMTIIIIGLLFACGYLWSKMNKTGSAGSSGSSGKRR